VIAEIREALAPSNVPLYRHSGWAERFPFVIQGTTARGDDDFDLGLFRDAPVGAVLQRWRMLRSATGMRTAVHAHQVHGATVLTHEVLPAGMVVADDADGHVTAVRGVLLSVSVADCVPVAIVAARRRAVAALHAGWRGVAAGVLESGVRALAALGAHPDELWLHLGPAICGRCYEVGPDVHEALGLSVPDANAPVDLRALLATRAVALGIPQMQLSRSSWCTRCDAARFFSHRAGSGGRQMSVIGLLP
jgi:hypothetical protein